MAYVSTCVFQCSTSTYVGSQEGGMSYGVQMGHICLHWKSRGENVVPNPNHTEVKLYADDLNVNMIANITAC